MNIARGPTVVSTVGALTAVHISWQQVQILAARKANRLASMDGCNWARRNGGHIRFKA